MAASDEAPPTGNALIHFAGAHGSPEKTGSAMSASGAYTAVAESASLNRKNNTRRVPMNQCVSIQCHTIEELLKWQGYEVKPCSHKNDEERWELRDEDNFYEVHVGHANNS